MIEYSFFGADASLHHVGLGVKSIREISPASATIVDETERVIMAFIRLGGATIELLEPLSEDSPIARNVRSGVKLLHLCYEVPDLDQALELGKAAGFHRISHPRPTPVYDNRRVVWVFSKDYGLFELLEKDQGRESQRKGETPE